MPTNPRRSRNGPARLVLLALLSLVAAGDLAPPAAHAQALPGDVFYSAQVLQRFKYYVFVDDVVEWTNTTVAGTTLQWAAVRDTSTEHGTVGIATSIDAHDDYLELDLTSQMSLSARTGVFHETIDQVNLSIYIRGPAGTPYDITMATTGQLQASRVGGLPGSLQPVNGTTTAIFGGSTLNLPDGGVATLPINDFADFSGVTTAEILVGGETYSLAHQRVFLGRGVITQALCILGCMTAPAQFHSLSSGHVTFRVYPGGAPTAAPEPVGVQLPLMLAASPNPARSGTEVMFLAAAGLPVRVDVLDVRGRRVARLFDAVTDGTARTVPWNAGEAPAGVYFLRAESGGVSRTRKLTVVR